VFGVNRLRLAKRLTPTQTCLIDEANRLVYRIDGDDLVVITCRYHYD